MVSPAPTPSACRPDRLYLALFRLHGILLIEGCLFLGQLRVLVLLDLIRQVRR